MADTLLPFVVYETGLPYESDGAVEVMAGPVEIRERESGEVIATHDTLRAALADLLDDENYKPRAPLLRTDVLVIGSGIAGACPALLAVQRPRDAGAKRRA